MRYLNGGNSCVGNSLCAKTDSLSSPASGPTIVTRLGRTYTEANTERAENPEAHVRNTQDHLSIILILILIWNSFVCASLIFAVKLSRADLCWFRELDRFHLTPTGVCHLLQSIAPNFGLHLCANRTPPFSFPNSGIRCSLSTTQWHANNSSGCSICFCQRLKRTEHGSQRSDLGCYHVVEYVPLS